MILFLPHVAVTCVTIDTLLFWNFRIVMLRHWDHSSESCRLNEVIHAKCWLHYLAQKKWLNRWKIVFCLPGRSH